MQVIEGNLCLQNWIQVPTRDVLDMFFDYIIQQQSCPENEFGDATPGFELCSGSSVCYHGRKRRYAGGMGHQLWRNEARVELLLLQQSGTKQKCTKIRQVFPSKRRKGHSRIRGLEDQPDFCWGVLTIGRYGNGYVETWWVLRCNGGLFFPKHEYGWGMIRYDDCVSVYVFKEASRHDRYITKSISVPIFIETPCSYCLLCWVTSTSHKEFQNNGKLQPNICSHVDVNSKKLKGCGSAIASLDYAQSLKVGLCQGTEFLLKSFKLQKKALESQFLVQKKTLPQEPLTCR